MNGIVGEVVRNTVGRVIDRIADKYLPASISEKEREEFRLEARRLAVDEYRASVAETDGARGLAAGESVGAPAWTKVLTVTHRPFWSFLMLLVFIWTAIAPYAGYPLLALSETHKDIMQTVIIFYFGGRSVEKVTGILRGR